MMSRRTHGKLAFAKIRDDGSDIQLCFIRDKCKLYTGKKVVQTLKVDDQEITAYKFADKFIDVGDFI
ncbi:hypothetical protein KKG31_06285 [Patescibacteria group bacterium]|nr:hypothetical protein [Patescibacteria group bacterium]MBU1758706.1 hypothetical protein [Patescibacteria group bacterium]